MRAVLLSIKPEFAHKIFDGTKKYEFRKKVFKDETVRKVIVYSSFPERKVLGEFEIDSILNGTPREIWRLTKDASGITQTFYNEYFENKEMAYAIKVASVCEYKIQKNLIDYNVRFAPQSFVYVEV